MSYKITILKSSVQKQPKGYWVAEVAYKTDDGKTKGMKILDFVQKDVFAVAKEAKPGDILDADFEKNAKGFWTFKTLVPTGLKEDVSAVATVSAPASKGNWETSEERAARQVMIVRQSSLSAANATLEANKGKFSPEDVIDVAKIYEAYVLGTVVQTGEIE